MARIVSLYDHSGIMLRRWAADGYEAIAVDILTRTDHRDAFGVWHMGLDAMSPEVETLVSKASILVAFPPCTDLAISGSRHHAAKGEKVIEAAMELVYRVPDLGYRYRIPWMLENPISIISSRWRKPDYIFDPYEFGGYLPPDHKPAEYLIPKRDAYLKRTCLWYGCGFKPPRKRPVARPTEKAPQYLYLGGKQARVKRIRSMTPEGFAIAVYEANKGVGRA